MEDPDATPMSSLFLPSKRQYGHQTSSSSSSSETSMTGTQTSFTSSSPSTNARLYLTVDCGGSKAAAAISSSSPDGGPPVFLSRGFGGAANYTDLGLHRFLKSVRKAVENALDQAGIDWQAMLTKEQLARGHSSGSRNPKTNGLPPISAKVSPSMSPASVYSNLSDGNEEAAEDLPFSFPPIFHAAWLGIAGVDSPRNISALSPHLSTLLAIPYPSPRLIVANDSSLLASPVMEGEAQEDTGVREGVVCIAGTGSIVMSFRSRPRHQNPPSTPTAATDSSRNDSPTSSMSSSSLASAGGLLEAVGRVGGLGWLLGDEAGGYVVGKKAVRAVLDQADRERLGIEEDEEENSDQEDDSQATPMKRPHFELHQQDSTRLTSTNLSSAATSNRIDKKHLLRDRILAHWGLSSTNDILDTVYANDDFVISTASIGTGGHRASVNPSTASSVNGAHDDSDSNSSGRSTPAAARIDSVASLDATSAGLAAVASSESTPLPPGFRLEPSSPTISRDDIRGGTSPIPAIPSYPSSPKPEARQAQAGDAGAESPADTGDTASTSDLPSTNSSTEAAAPRRPSLMTEMFEGLMTSKTSGSSSSSSSLYYGSSSSSSSSPSPVEPSQASMERRQTLRGGPPAEDRTVKLSQDAHHNQCQQGAKTLTETNNSPNQQQPQGFVRKLRLASLAPLVFHLAFTHGDPLSLSILRNEIRKLVRQIQLLCQREGDATGSKRTQSRPWTRDPRRIRPLYSTLCLGGSLLSVEAYRSLLIEELAKQGWQFGKVVYVQDVARRGSEALAKGWEE